MWIWRKCHLCIVSRQKQSVNFKINIIQKKVNENNETYQKKCIFAALYFIVCQNRRK